LHLRIQETLQVLSGVCGGLVIPDTEFDLDGSRPAGSEGVQIYSFHVFDEFPKPTIYEALQALSSVHMRHASTKVSGVCGGLVIPDTEFDLDGSRAAGSEGVQIYSFHVFDEFPKPTIYEALQALSSVHMRHASTKVSTLTIIKALLP
jgi:hypothetical protein